MPEAEDTIELTAQGAQEGSQVNRWLPEKVERTVTGSLVRGAGGGAGHGFPCEGHLTLKYLS